MASFLDPQQMISLIGSNLMETIIKSIISAIWAYTEPLLKAEIEKILADLQSKV